MRLLSFILAAMLFFSCDNSQNPDLTTPGKVTWVSKTTDMAEVERGIDAVPESDGIFLQWFRMQEEGIAFYNIFRRNENETFFSRIRQINISQATAGRDTTHIDTDPLLNIYNYYYVTAENRDGVQGTPSDTIRYKLLEKAETTKPNTETVQGLPTFFWTFITFPPDSFILRIEEDFPPYGLHFARKYQSDYNNNAQVLDLSVYPDPPGFESSRLYKWRIDVIGAPDSASGSESQYLQFRVQ